MKKSYFLIYLLIILVIGCSPTSPSTQPKKEETKYPVEFTLSKTDVTINNGESDAFRITLKQLTDVSENPYYLIKLISPNPSLIYFENSKKEKISNITTQEFKNVGDIHNEDVTILGKISGGQDSANYVAKIELWDHKNNQLPSYYAEIKIEVINK